MMLEAAGFTAVETLNYAPNRRTGGKDTIVADMRAFKPGAG
jgi:hypothetical protein